MSKKKLVGIIAGCIIAVIVVVVVAGFNFPGRLAFGLVYQADFSSVEPGTETQVMQAAKGVIQKRIAATNVSDSTVQVQEHEGEYRIVIQVPGTVDIEQVKDVVELPAVLEFREQDAQGNWIPAAGIVDGENLTLTSEYFGQNTYVAVSQNGQPILVFQWGATGAQLSKQITTRLLGKPIAIFSDGEPLRTPDGQIIAPIVQAVIEDKGQIEGLSLTDASRLRDLLNAGQIPVPLGRWVEEGQSRVFEPNVPLYEGPVTELP